MRKKFAAVLIFALWGCVPAETAEMSAQETGGREAVETRIGAEEALADLPYARGRSFESLRAYLAYLEQYNGPIDLPWWRELRPGVYQQVIRMTDAEPETATREELMQRFGFAR